MLMQGRRFDLTTLPMSSTPYPTVLHSVREVQHLLELLGKLSISPGIPDEKFLPLAQLRKGQFLDRTGNDQLHMQQSVLWPTKSLAYHLLLAEHLDVHWCILGLVVNVPVALSSGSLCMLVCVGFICARLKMK